MCAIARASQGRLRLVSIALPQQRSHILHTIQCRIHPPHVDQQAHHGHCQRTVDILQELLLQDLATLAALRHGVDVDLGERPALTPVAVLGEALGVVVEDQTKEVVLDVLPPQWDAVLLL